MARITSPARNVYCVQCYCILERHLLPELRLYVQSGQGGRVRGGSFPFLQLETLFLVEEVLCILIHFCSGSARNVSEALQRFNYRLCFTFVPDLGLMLLFPLKSTKVPRHPAPYGLGKAMKCVSERIKFMVYSKLLLFHFNAA